MILGLVVPCYNEEAVLPDTIETLTKFYDQLIKEGLISDKSIIAFVDDGSKDKTWEIIESTKNKHVRGAKLSRNRGHQNALLAGLTTFNEEVDAIVTIDADLQDDVQAIREMVIQFQAGHDIVYGVRKKRKTDSFFKRTSAQMFYRFQAMFGVKTIYNHADFRLMSRRAVSALLQYQERNLFLRGIVPEVGYKSCQVFYDRLPRMKGETKYPLKKMLAFACDGITSFSNKPITYVRKFGTFLIFASLLAAATLIVLDVLDILIFTEMLIICLSIALATGLIIFSLGIVGLYIGKIYQEVKGRPRFFVETVYRPDDINQ